MFFYHMRKGKSITCEKKASVVLGVTTASGISSERVIQHAAILNHRIPSSTEDVGLTLGAGMFTLDELTISPGPGNRTASHLDQVIKARFVYHLAAYEGIGQINPIQATTMSLGHPLRGLKRVDNVLGYEII